MHNHSMPTDVGYAPSRLSLVRCPLPLKVLTHKAMPLANPVQCPHTRLYLITQIKPQDLMLFMPKVQIWTCVGTYDLPLQQSHWKATSYSHLACLIPRGSEAHKETSTSIKQERCSWGTCRVNLPGKLSFPSKAASCKHRVKKVKLLSSLVVLE